MKEERNEGRERRNNNLINKGKERKGRGRGEGEGERRKEKR